MCSFLSVTGKHLVLLGISGVDDVMTMFTSDDEGNVIMKVRGISSNEDPSSFNSLQVRNDSAKSETAECLLHLATTLNPQMLQ